jgi:diamine N-acetyltransferase
VFYHAGGWRRWGQIYFNDIETKDGIKRVELDMWMKAEKYCGRGFGSDALETLCVFLSKRFGVEKFMVQPEIRGRCGRMKKLGL